MRKRVSITGRGAEFYPSPDQLRQFLNKSAYRKDIEFYLSNNRASVENLINWPKEGNGLQPDIGILRHFLAGNIIIEPFNIAHLQDTGYDVSLGEWTFAQSDFKVEPGPSDMGIPDLISFLVWKIQGEPYESFNPFFQMDYWESKPCRAKKVEELIEWCTRGVFREKIPWLMRVLRDRGYALDKRFFLMEPGQMLLGHTEEFIGGQNVIATTISGKSSVGRHGVEVCSDANRGGVGFINRWALELLNKSNTRPMIMAVGQPIATVQFFCVEPPLVNYRGRYQKSVSLRELIASWEPWDLLPKKPVLPP